MTEEEWSRRVAELKALRVIALSFIYHSPSIARGTYPSLNFFLIKIDPLFNFSTLFNRTTLPWIPSARTLSRRKFLLDNKKMSLQL